MLEKNSRTCRYSNYKDYNSLRTFCCINKFCDKTSWNENKINTMMYKLTFVINYALTVTCRALLFCGLALLEEHWIWARRYFHITNIFLSETCACLSILKFFSSPPFSPELNDAWSDRFIYAVDGYIQSQIL